MSAEKTTLNSNWKKIVLTTLLMPSLWVGGVPSAHAQLPSISPIESYNAADVTLASDQSTISFQPVRMIYDFFENKATTTASGNSYPGIPSGKFSGCVKSSLDQIVADEGQAWIVPGGTTAAGGFAAFLTWTSDTSAAAQRKAYAVIATLWGTVNVLDYWYLRAQEGERAKLVQSLEKELREKGKVTLWYLAAS